jgi:hypothetical protein
MAIGAPANRPAAAAGAAARGQSRWYELYGLLVQSDLWLPPAAGCTAPRRAPDLVFRRMPTGQPPPEPDGPLVAATPCPVHGADALVHHGPGGYWLWNREFGTCHVLPGARQVDVYPLPGADERALGFLLAGRVAVFVLHRRGFPTLHASAVLTDRGALAFLGPAGQGKSTMAAVFLARGAMLLTDDVLPLQVRPDGVYGTPSLPLMKLWQPTAKRTLALSEDLPVLWENYDKRMLAVDGRFGFAAAPARLRALYVLERYDPAATGRGDVVCRRLSGHEGLSATLAQISYGAFLRPPEVGQLLPLFAHLVAQAPVRRLSYPDGFEFQDAVYTRILDDLAETVRAGT